MKNWCWEVVTFVYSMYITFLLLYPEYEFNLKYYSFDLATFHRKWCILGPSLSYSSIVQDLEKCGELRAISGERQKGEKRWEKAAEVGVEVISPVNKLFGNLSDSFHNMPSLHKHESWKSLTGLSPTPPWHLAKSIIHSSCFNRPQLESEGWPLLWEK